VNDRGLELSKDLKQVRGKIVWIYVPNQGRYLISLAPRTELGLKLEGEVSGTSLKFRAGDDGIRVDSGEKILAGSATYNLYVLSQPRWLPPNGSVRSMALLDSEDGDDSR
jgi:hypothetical protein